MEASYDFRQFSLYTYAETDVYIEPFLTFMREVCRLGEPSGLPISLSWNSAPREVRFTDESWARFEKRARTGRIRTADAIQFASEGMTMVSFEPWDRPLPFTLTSQLVPDGGVPAKTRDRTFQLVNMYSLRRYPSNLTLEIDVKAFPPRTAAEVTEHLHRLQADLLTSAEAACACVTQREMRRGGPLALSPVFFDDKSLAEHLDTCVPGIFWALYLGPGHIEKLGGKNAAVRSLAEYHVDDLSTERADYLYVQFTRDIDRFHFGVMEKYCPALEPLLPGRESAAGG